MKNFPGEKLSKMLCHANSFCRLWDFYSVHDHERQVSRYPYIYSWFVTGGKKFQENDDREERSVKIELFTKNTDDKYTDLFTVEKKEIQQN